MTKTNSSPGSPEYQITSFTQRILHLAEHLKTNKKDFSAKKGLLDLVSKRHRLLKYKARIDHEGYLALCNQLGLRK